MMHHKLATCISGRGMEHHGPFWASDTSIASMHVDHHTPAMFRACRGVTTTPDETRPNRACKLQSFPGFKRSKSSALHTCTWNQITPFSFFTFMYRYAYTHTHHKRIGGSEPLTAQMLEAHPEIGAGGSNWRIHARQWKDIKLYGLLLMLTSHFVQSCACSCALTQFCEISLVSLVPKLALEFHTRYDSRKWKIQNAAFAFILGLSVQDAFVKFVALSSLMVYVQRWGRVVRQDLAHVNFVKFMHRQEAIWMKL